MLKFLKSLFGIGPYSERHPLDAVTTPNVSAPYKVPEPVATTPIPYVPEPPLVKLGPEPKLGHDMGGSYVIEESTPKPKAVAKPKKQQFDKKPAAAKAAKPAAAKAPAKPKAPATKKPKISIAK